MSGAFRVLVAAASLIIRGVVRGADEGRLWMLSLEGDVEVHALRDQGWSISAIARHTGLDRKTVRAYLNGERVPG
nr:hypothetical protein [Nocardia sp. BSTN01]